MTENPENGKAHLIFELKTPIYTTDASYPKPIIYANAIIKRLQQLFNADVGYSGLITKNPISSEWRAYTLRSKPYSLNELANKLEINWKEANQPIRQDEAVGLVEIAMYSIQHVFGHTKRFENLGAVRITHGLNVF